MTWYRTGTANVVAGSTAVGGIGTLWNSQAKAGEAFLGPDGALYEIQSIASDTSLILRIPYAGPTFVGGQYAIVPTQSYMKVLSSQVSDLLALYQAAPSEATEAAVTAAIAEAQAVINAAQGSLDNKVGTATAAAASAQDSANQAATVLVNALTKGEASAADGATKVGTSEGTVQEALDVRVKAPELRAPAGSGEVGYSSLEAYVAGTLGRKLKAFVVVTDAPFNAACDGVTDDSLAVQAAVNYVESTGCGDILIPGLCLVGGIIVTKQGVVLKGRSIADGLIAKNGTLGVHFKDSYSYCQNMTIWGQGSISDGLNTRGILHSKGSGSIGHILQQNVNFRNFSGVPFEGRNLIHSNFVMSLFILCAHGPVIEREAIGGANFSTTVNISDWYVLACGDGGNFKYLYESKVHVIVEDCAAPLQITAGRMSLSAWLEDNAAGGINITDALVFSESIYRKGVNDTVTRNWTPGVIAAADRGYREFNNMDVTAKRVGLLSGFGVDPKYFAAIGTTNNTGLSYGDNLVPLVRGRNLIDPSAWVSNRLGELKGWDAAHQGFKVSGVGGGDLSHGLTQNVTVSTTKRYVIDFTSITVSGAPLSTLRCGTLVVTSGVPFTPSESGSLAVKAFGIGESGVAFESYVTAFSISEVAVDSSLGALVQSRLTAPQDGRGVVYRTAAPTNGSWGLTESVVNPSTSFSSPVRAWTCVATPATFRPSSWVVGMGPTANRPVLTASDVGVTYLDTTLAAAGQLISWNGAAWVNHSGSIV